MDPILKELANLNPKTDQSLSEEQLSKLCDEILLMAAQIIEAVSILREGLERCRTSTPTS